MGKELPDMKKVLFRGAVAGYNKSDVNEYIADTDKRHAEEMAEAERRINELTSELETCKSVSAMKISGLEEAEKKAREAAAELERSLADAKAEAARKVAAAENSAAAAKSKCADAEGRLARQNDELSRLRAALATAGKNAVSDDELADLRRRAAAYDELEARRMTAPVVGAEAEADNVIRSAQTEAESIRREAKAGGAAAVEETKKQVSGELAEIYDMINRAAAESVEDILAGMRAAEAGFGKLGEQLHDQNRDAVARVESLRAEIEKKIGERLDEARSRVEAEHKETARAAAADKTGTDTAVTPATAKEVQAHAPARQQQRRTELRERGAGKNHREMKDSSASDAENEYRRKNTRPEKRKNDDAERACG